MKTSESTAEISKALVAMELMLENPAKNATAKVATKTGRDYQYSYATLPDILEEIRPLLHGNGLFLTMDTVTENGRAGVSARLTHVSGEWFEFGPLLLPAGNDAQGAGSAISYARRYLLCAALNIAADEDDDGERAAAPNRDGSTGRTGRAADKRPEPDSYGEGETGSGPTSATGGDSSTVGTGDSAAVPPVPEPHEHVPGLQRLASGKALCIYERADGTVCGQPFQPKPTVFTEPVQERADIK